MTVATVGNSASLTAALRVAQPGDTVLLAPGDYATISIGNVHFAGGVTIASADRANRAVIHTFDVHDSSGLTFRDLEMISTPGGDLIQHLVTSSADIHFEKLYVHGTLNGDPADDVAGLQIRDSSDVTITASEFEQVVWGVSHLNTTRLTISGNLFHDVRLDGVRGGGSSYITITGNTFRDFHINPGDHGDAIQFWTTNTTTSAHDILVADNVFVRGAGTAIQGVFMRDEVGGIPYEHVTIRGNLLAGTTFHGISLDGARDVTIEDNIVQGFLDKKAWIRLENVQGAQLTHNSATQITITANSTGVGQSGSTILPLTNDGGAAALRAWQADHPVLLKLSGTAAADILVSGMTASSLRGNEGGDLLVGGAAFDDLNGNQGDDTVSGGPGDDWVVGGKDQDLLFGDAGADLVYGNLGNDIGYGGDGDDIMRGGQDNDVLSGGAGADFLSGDKGDDTMTGGAGADIFHTFTDAGLDWVTDFNPSEGDRIQVDPGTLYTATQVGPDTVISMAGGQMVLFGVALVNLAVGWIFGD